MNEEFDFVKSIRDMIGMIDSYNPTAYKLVQFQIDSCLQYECITKENMEKCVEIVKNIIALYA